MSRHRDEHLELCAGYVLDTLSDAERRELEAHLAGGCEPCEAELRALSAGAAVLAMSAPPHRAPAAVRARVLAAIEASGASGAQAGPGAQSVIPMPRRAWPGGVAGALLAAAAVIVAVAVGVVAWRRTDELQRELLAARERTTELQRKLDEERAWGSLLTAPASHTITLAPTTQGATTLTAELHYDPASDRAILLAQGFAPPGARDYELWAITAAGPTSLGLVHADADGRAVVRLEHIARDGAVAAFAVSLEVTGGSPDHHKPAGPVVMLGKLAG
jgi:anti-sigma-K factor RskA